MIKSLALIFAVLSVVFAQKSNTDSTNEFGQATVTWFGFPNCTAESGSKNNNQEGPFRTSVTTTPGVCNLADGKSVNSGSWIVNCPGKDNKNNDGTLFFCSDNNCGSCSAFPFKNSGSDDNDVQCYNTNQGPPGAQSFTARCEAGNRAEEQAESSGVKEMVTAGFSGAVVAALGLTMLG